MRVSCLVLVLVERWNADERELGPAGPMVWKEKRGERKGGREKGGGGGARKPTAFQKLAPFSRAAFRGLVASSCVILPDMVRSRETC